MDLLKPRTRAQSALLWTSAFTALGVLLAIQEALTVRGSLKAVDLVAILESRLVQSYATLLTSLMAWFALTTIRTARVSWWVKLPLHLSVFACFAMLSVVFATTSRYWTDPGLRASLTWPQAVIATFERSFSFMGLLYGLVVLGESLAGSIAAERQRALENVDLRGRLSEARLEALRLQLQPHFLFNTLHAASALIETAPASARRVLVDLGDLLRASLERSSEHEVPLKRELQLLDHYLDIQRVRFGDRLAFHVDVPEETLEFAVPAMLLQPLVENAIRHGLADRPGRGEMKVSVSTEGASLDLTVTDDGAGLSEGMLREGVGLGNTRARLAGLYGTDASIGIESNPSGGTVVRVHLPARPWSPSVTDSKKP